LKTETDSRDSHGGQARIKQARFPARKTLEEFDFAFQTSIAKNAVLHLGQLDFLAGRENVVLLGPPDRGSWCFLSIMVDQESKVVGGNVDAKATSAALGDVDRASLAALDLMQHGLAGNAEALGAATFAAWPHVRSQPRARGEVLIPGHIIGMVLGQADRPLRDGQLDRLDAGAVGTGAPGAVGRAVPCVVEGEAALGTAAYLASSYTATSGLAAPLMTAAQALPVVAGAGVVGGVVGHGARALATEAGASQETANTWAWAPPS
jgi:hypothetical protein